MKIEFIAPKAFRMPWITYNEERREVCTDYTLHISLGDAQDYYDRWMPDGIREETTGGYCLPELNPWEEDIPLDEVDMSDYARLIELGTIWW